MVWQVKDSQWHQVEPSRNGKYLLLTMEGTDGTFCVQPQSAVPWPVIGAFGGAAVLILLLVFVGKHLQDKRAARSAKKAAEAARIQEDTEHIVK